MIAAFGVGDALCSWPWQCWLPLAWPLRILWPKALCCCVLRFLSYRHGRQLEAVPAEVLAKNDFHALGCFPLMGNDEVSLQAPLRHPKR